MVSTSPPLTPASPLTDSDRPDPRSQPLPAQPRTARTFILALLLALLMLAPTLLYPVGRDTANFLYVARVMTRGGTLYRDAWELKPPGIFLAFSALTRTCSGAALVPYTHLVDIALCGLVGLLLVRLANALGAPAAGWAAAAWYASFYLEGGFGNFAETEGWANPAVLIATLLCLQTVARRHGKKERDLFYIGLLAGVAALIKFTMLAPLLPFVALALWRSRSLRAALSFGGGFAILFATSILWLKATGAWVAYEDIQRNFVVPYVAYGSAPAGPHLRMLVQFVSEFVATLWLPAIFALIAIRSRNWTSQFKLPVLTALALCLVAIWIQQKCILYYWQALLPLVSLLAAFGSLEVMRLARVAPRHQAAVALLFALGWHAYRNLPEYALSERYATGSVGAREWQIHFNLPHEDDPVRKAYTAAGYVSAHTNRDDTILVYGFESIIYILSDRYAPSRFFFDPPVVSTYSPNAWRAEFLRDLQGNPPKLILLRHGDTSNWIGGPPGDSCALFREVPAQEAWLEAHYHFDHDDGGFAFFARNDRGAQPLKSPENPPRNPLL